MDNSEFTAAPALPLEEDARRILGDMESAKIKSGLSMAGAFLKCADKDPHHFIQVLRYLTANALAAIKGHDAGADELAMTLQSRWIKTQEMQEHLETSQDWVRAMAFIQILKQDRSLGQVVLTLPSAPQI